MRFILQDVVEERLPADWDEVVAEAKDYVHREATKVRQAVLAAGKTVLEAEDAALKATHKAINKRAHVWKHASEALRKANSNKCWYCEVRQDRSDMPIDHFRPKNRVQEAPGHPGYWWLAFDWRNFRFSCTFCNSKRRDVRTGKSGGKQDHFPVVEPPPHARCDTDPVDNPKLLDPTDDRDPTLLTFLLNGFPSPTSPDKTSLGFQRAKESIRLYHLDHTHTVRRRKNLAMDIKRWFELAQQALQVGNEEFFRKCKKELIKHVRGEAELSSAARIYLGAYRSEPWVQEILNHHL